MLRFAQPCIISMVPKTMHQTKVKGTVSSQFGRTLKGLNSICSQYSQQGYNRNCMMKALFMFSNFKSGKAHTRPTNQSEPDLPSLPGIEAEKTLL